MSNERLLTVEEVAEQLNVCTSYIYRLTHLKRIPYIRLGKYVRFKPADIDRWIESRTRGGDSVAK